MCVGERAGLGARDPVEARQRRHGVDVRVSVGEQRFVDRRRDPPARTALAFLVVHDLSRAGKRVVGDGRAALIESRGLDREQRLELRRPRTRGVGRRILLGERVVGERGGLEVNAQRRAVEQRLEQDMLDDVRETLAARRIVRRTDAIANRDRDLRRARFAHEHHAEAVREPPALGLEPDLDRAVRAGEERGAASRRPAARGPATATSSRVSLPLDLRSV